MQYLLFGFKHLNNPVTGPQLLGMDLAQTLIQVNPSLWLLWPQVLSVDACQGSEADGVVLSTVRNLAGPSPGLSRCARPGGGWAGEGLQLALVSLSNCRSPP